MEDKFLLHVVFRHSNINISSSTNPSILWIWGFNKLKTLVLFHFCPTCQQKTIFSHKFCAHCIKYWKLNKVFINLEYVQKDKNFHIILSILQLTENSIWSFSLKMQENIKPSPLPLFWTVLYKIQNIQCQQETGWPLGIIICIFFNIKNMTHTLLNWFQSADSIQWLWKFKINNTLI